MKQCLFILLYYCVFNQINAQKTNHLQYFINKKDSLVGVKDSKGNIVIPSDYSNASLEYFDEKIPDNATSIIMQRIKSIKGKPAISFGDAFDRKGNLLYHPLFFDNGPDYFSEGTIRCVENGKVGFVNREEKIIIKPQWDWAGEFNYGYAFVCNGCYFDFSKDSEHPELAFYPNHESYYINKMGIIVYPTKVSTDSILDYPTKDSCFLPYPFHYDAFEQSLVDSFNNLRVLKHIDFTSMGYTTPNHPIRFELTERPSSTFPFYTIEGFERLDKSIYYSWNNTFLVDVKGNWFYYDKWTNKKMNFKKWLKQQRYTQEHKE